MWGHVKNVVCVEKMQNINHLKERIEAAIRNIIQDIF
jgi:hypothetical protein